MLRILVGRGARLLPVLVGLCVLSSCRAQPPQYTARDEWASVQVGTARIGYLHLTTGLEAAGERSGCLRMGLELRLRLSELGMPTEVEVSIQQWIDPRTRRPVRVEAMLPAGAEPTRKVIDFGKDQVTVRRIAYDGERTTTLDIPKDAALRGDLQFLLDPLREGEEKATSYNILSDTLETASTKVTRTEQGWTVSGAASIGQYTMQLADDGRLVSGVGMLGVRLVAQSEDEARNLGAGDYTPPLEFGVGAKVERPLPQPSRITRLEASLSGLSLEEGIPDIEGRQEARMRDGGVTRVTVHADDIRRHHGPTVGYEIPPDIRPLAEPDGYIVSTDPTIVQTAREVAGEEKDASRVAERLCAWVDRKLTFGGALDSARTSAEILAAGRGVCRDYAALYAGLARSLGIPTRLCTGLVYVSDGFYLHTWAESWFGPETGWVPLDPTRSGLPVDATHITLLRGGVDSVWEIMRVCGDLRVEGISVETSPPPPPLPFPMPLLGG
jgi:hypothetical protein